MVEKKIYNTEEEKRRDNRTLAGSRSIMISEILLIGQISERVPSLPLWRTGQTERREGKQNIDKTWEGRHKKAKFDEFC